MYFLVRSCLLITLIKCLKGHKSLGSLCNVLKTLIVSGAGPSKGHCHLLSCSGQLKMLTAFAAIQELVKKLFGQSGGLASNYKPHFGSSSSGLSLGSVRLG